MVGLPKHIKNQSNGHQVGQVNITEKGLKAIMSKVVIILFTMILISSFGLAGFESIYTLYVNQVFKFTLNEISITLILNGIFSLILQVLLFDKLVNFFSEIRLTRICFLISTIGIVWLLFAIALLKLSLQPYWYFVPLMFYDLLLLQC